MITKYASQFFKAGYGPVTVAGPCFMTGFATASLRCKALQDGFCAIIVASLCLKWSFATAPQRVLARKFVCFTWLSRFYILVLICEECCCDKYLPGFTLLVCTLKFTCLKYFFYFCKV